MFLLFFYCSEGIILCSVQKRSKSLDSSQVNVYEAPSSMNSKTYAFLTLDWKVMLKLRSNQMSCRQSEGRDTHLNRSWSPHSSSFPKIWSRYMGTGGVGLMRETGELEICFEIQFLWVLFKIDCVCVCAIFPALYQLLPPFGFYRHQWFDFHFLPLQCPGLFFVENYSWVYKHKTLFAFFTLYAPLNFEGVLFLHCSFTTKVDGYVLGVFRKGIAVIIR